MKDNYLSVGINLANTNHNDIFRFIDSMRNNKKYIHDFHFAHPNPSICKTGRNPMYIDKKTFISYIRILSISGYNTTILLNLAEECNFEKIVKDLKDYVDNGLSAICTH